MSQDKSQLQVVEKFSFIYTLTHSSNQKTKKLAKNVSVDIHESRNTLDRESCGELVHSSSSDSVTLSSVLGFPNIIGNNESGLCLLNEPSIDRSFTFSQQTQLPGQQNKSNSFITKHFGKIALLLSSSYLLFVAYWLAGHSYYGRIFPFSTLRAILNISESQVSASDLQFIDYLKRSLNNIEFKQDTQLSNSADEPDNSEVVYVPVYNLSKTDTASEKYAAHSGYPLNNSPLPVPIIPPPPPRKVTLPTFSSSKSTKTNTTAKLSSPSIPQSSAVATEKIATASTTQTAKKYTLIGIFELGDRSAALFRVDGATKRIWVGDKLDNRGWILDSVVNQKAKISRQGEIRSLSVGEKF